MNHDNNEIDRTDTVFTKLLFFLPVTRKKELDEALVSMIVKDTQPFSTVEDKGFREFVAKLDQTYVLPTRKVCLVTWIKHESTIELKKINHYFLPFL